MQGTHKRKSSGSDICLRRKTTWAFSQRTSILPLNNHNLWNQITARRWWGLHSRSFLVRSIVSSARFAQVWELCWVGLSSCSVPRWDARVSLCGASGRWKKHDKIMNQLIAKIRQTNQNCSQYSGQFYVKISEKFRSHFCRSYNLWITEFLIRSLAVEKLSIFGDGST